MPDDGVSDDHSVTSRLAERSEAATGGDLEDRRGRIRRPVLECVFRCCAQGPEFPGTGVKDIWEDRVPGARGLCRETHGVEVVGVLAVRCILTLQTCERQPGMFPALLSVSSAGPAS